MHVCSALLGNPSPCSCCLCLHCSAPLKTTQVPRLLLNCSLNTVGGHRPRGEATGHGKLVIGHKFGSRPTIHSRPALKMADRPSIPAEPYFAVAEDKQSMAMHFQSNVCTTTLPIMLWTQGSVILDPRIIDQAFQCMMIKEVKCATSMLNEMHTNTQ